MFLFSTINYEMLTIYFFRGVIDLSSIITVNYLSLSFSGFSYVFLIDEEVGSPYTFIFILILY